MAVAIAFGANYGNAALAVEWTPLEGLTLTPGVQYIWLWDSEIRDAADESESLYNDGGQWVVSLQAGYVF